MLISPALLFSGQQSVLIPWQDIQPGKIHNEGFATMIRLDVSTIDITRMDYIRYIEKRVRA